MKKKIVGAAIALSLVAGLSHSVQPASAQVTPEEVNKRKEIIHSCLLNIYMAQKKRSAVLAEYQILLGMRPDDTKFRFGYGRYLAASGVPADISNGLVQMKKGLQGDPTNGDYNFIIGSLLLKQKKAQEALPYLKDACTYSKGNKEYLKYYEDTFKYIDGVKRAEIAKKRQAEYQKKMAAQQTQVKKQNAEDDDW